MFCLFVCFILIDVLDESQTTTTVSISIWEVFLEPKIIAPVVYSVHTIYSFVEQNSLWSQVWWLILIA